MPGVAVSTPPEPRGIDRFLVPSVKHFKTALEITHVVRRNIVGQNQNLGVVGPVGLIGQPDRLFGRLSLARRAVGQE